MAEERPSDRERLERYNGAIVEIANVLRDKRALDAEKVRTVRRILRTIGVLVPEE